MQAEQGTARPRRRWTSVPCASGTRDEERAGSLLIPRATISVLDAVHAGEGADANATSA